MCSTHTHTHARPQMLEKRDREEALARLRDGGAVAGAAPVDKAKKAKAFESFTECVLLPCYPTLFVHVESNVFILLVVGGAERGGDVFEGMAVCVLRFLSVRTQCALEF